MDTFIAFKASTGFSSQTIASWRHSPSRDAKPAPYFLLQDGETEACGINCFDPIFGTNLIICQGNKKYCEQWVNGQFSKLNNTFEIPKEPAYAWHMRRDENISVIWISTQTEECGAKIMSVIAHEAIHCAFETSKHIGISCFNGSEEFFTYYMQWVMNQYLDALGYDPEVTETESLAI